MTNSNDLEKELSYSLKESLEINSSSKEALHQSGQV